MDNCFVNGLPNTAISHKIFQEGRQDYKKEFLQAVPGKSFEFIKIELDHFIGNPK
jgi:hypothetical protein